MCQKVYHSTQQGLDHLQIFYEADLRIPMHLFNCDRTGYSTFVVLSPNDTAVIAAHLLCFNVS